MDLSFNGGTAQQRKWVQDALDDCGFPVDKLQVPVEVSWGAFPNNADIRHPFMVTQVDAAGDQFIITIAPWADDPTAPLNRGLADPAGDIYTFYKQSFVHELGHVVTYCTIDPENLGTDPKVGQACGLFWHPEVDNSAGRRYGTTSDWDSPSLAWADEIREAVAEVFKIAFYRGRLIFANRTNWKIDAIDWPTLMKLFSFTTYPFRATLKNQAAQYDPVTKQLGPYPVAAIHTVDPTFAYISDDGFVLPANPPTQVGTAPAFETNYIGGAINESPTGVASVRIDGDTMNFPDDTALKVVVGCGPSPGFSQIAAAATLTITRQNIPGAYIPNAFLQVSGVNVNVQEIYSYLLQSFPCWLVCRVTMTDVTAELWLTDPDFSATGAPLFSVSVPSNNSGVPMAALLGAEGVGQARLGGQFEPFNGTPGVQLSDWRWAGMPVDVASPYPLAPPEGLIVPGPAAAGVILIGHG